MTNSSAYKSIEITQIYDMLYMLGITAECTEFFHVSYAVYSAVKQPKCLLMVNKLLYPKVAKHYGTTWQNVERSICSVAAAAWDRNRSYLEKLACCPLSNRLSASQFLIVLTDALFPDHVA